MIKITEIHQTILKSIIALFIAMVLFSCENKMQEIKKIEKPDSIPVESANTVKIIYSDSGIVKIVLTSPRLVRKEGKEPTIEFPDGLKILYYNAKNEVTSELTARYGINYLSKNIMEARNNVIINNFVKQEIINTEKLVWDQKQKTVYSDVFVKRTNPDGVLYADGFDADENFITYTLRRPKGIISVETDENNTE